MLLSVVRLCALALNFLLPVVSHAQAKPVEIVVASFAPYLQPDANGMPNGPIMDLTALLFADLQQAQRVREVPPARAFQRLLNGKAMLTIAAAGNPGLTAIAQQGKEPLLSLTLNIYRQPGTPAIQTLADLAGKRVIFVAAYSYGDAEMRIMHNQPPTQRINANTHESALNMLMHNRADYLLDYAEPLREHLEKIPAGSLAADLIAETKMHWYLSRKYPDPHLLDRLDSAIRARTADGSISRLLPTKQ